MLNACNCTVRRHHCWWTCTRIQPWHLEVLGLLRCGMWCLAQYIYIYTVHIMHKLITQSLHMCLEPFVCSVGYCNLLFTPSPSPCFASDNWKNFVTDPGYSACGPASLRLRDPTAHMRGANVSFSTPASPNPALISFRLQVRGVARHDQATCWSVWSVMVCQCLSMLQWGLSRYFRPAFAPRYKISSGAQRQITIKHVSCKYQTTLL